MALVIEDGTGISGAEAYIAVVDADAYFSARGNTAWAALDTTAKGAALRNGCDFLESNYRWRGERATTTQTLSWPRMYVTVDGVDVASDSVPQAIQRANAELAVRASAAPLASDEGAQVVSEQVGPIAVTYAAGARQNPRYAAVDSLVVAYTMGRGAAAVVRA